MYNLPSHTTYWQGPGRQQAVHTNKLVSGSFTMRGSQLMASVHSFFGASMPSMPYLCIRFMGVVQMPVSQGPGG
jgi:hypothetical protein